MKIRRKVLNNGSIIYETGDASNVSFIGEKAEAHQEFNVTKGQAEDIVKNPKAYGVKKGKLEKKSKH